MAMARWVLPVPVPPIRTTLRWSATKLPVARSLTRPSLIGVPVKSNCFDVLGQRQLGDGHLVADGSGLLLGDLGLQQVTHDPGRLMLALDAGGHDLVIGAAHPVELEAAHQVEDLGAFHVGWSS